MGQKVSEKGSCSHSDTTIWKKLWSLNIPPRMKVFMWRLCNEALPTKANIGKRLPNFRIECEICGCSIELKVHVLLHCPLAARIWEGNNWKHRLWDEQFRTTRDCLDKALKASDNEELGQFVAIVWECWNG